MNLETNYLGLKLKNPLVVSSCRLSENIKNIKQMEAAGASAVVMYSIFEEEIRSNDTFIEYFVNENGTELFPEALTYFPKISNQASFLDLHLFHLEETCKKVNIPIIGSLNAVSHTGWLDYAIKMQATGISALEINLYYFPTKNESSEKIEQKYIALIKELKNKLNIPLAVKLSPFFTSIPNIVTQLEETNVDGIIFFNRFYYPDIDIDNLTLKTKLELSNSYESRLPFRWIALLQNQIKCSIAASTGVHTSKDLIKYILAGANVVMCASCLMINGVDYLKTLLSGLNEWMQNKNYQTIDEIRGLINKKTIIGHKELERAQYMHALRSYN